MRAVTLQHGRLGLHEVPTPEPGPGQVLVRTLACAVCASDHHYMDHPEVSRADRSSMRVDAPDRHVVMGHEFCAEVVAYGPDTRREWPVGTRVTSVPALFTPDGLRIIGMAPDAPGGFGERFLLSEGFARAVPDAVPVAAIALNDAMAVGWFYSRLGVDGAGGRRSVPLVLGLGAIGLSLVAALRHRGSGPVVAADFAPHRRDLAARLGADVLVDPAEESPWAAWRPPPKVHERRRTPTTAILFTTALAFGLITFVGAVPDLGGTTALLLLMVFAVVNVAVWVVESASDWMAHLMWRNLAQTIEHEARIDAYRHVQDLELAWFEDQSTGGLLSILNDDVNQLERFLDVGAIDILATAINVVFVGAVFFIAAPELGLVAFLPIPVIIWGSILFQRRLEPRYARVRQAAADVGGAIAGNLSGIATIRAFTAES